MVDAALVPAGKPKWVLLVEGPADVFIFRKLLDHLKLGDSVQVTAGKGYENLRKTIPVTVKALSDDESARLGIVADADASAGSRWNSIKGALAKSGYRGLPNAPVGTGAIFSQADLPTVGVWIMPDNASSGAIEHFLRLLIPDSDLLWPEAESAVKHTRTVEQRFRASYEMKAHVHTWLAWQEEPGQPTWEAITKTYFKANSPNAQALYTWLQKLFTL